MKFKKTTIAALTVAAFASTGLQAQTISGDTVKIGFITDLSGVYSDIDGPGGVEAIRMAIADMGGTVNGKKVELIVADHQNKPDIAATKAREWFDTQGVDMLNRSFLMELLPVDLLRGAGFFVFSMVGPLRRALMREGVLTHGALPRLMREQPRMRRAARS